MALHVKNRSRFLQNPIKLSPPQFLATLFLFLIFIGTCLLKLPVAHEQSLSWVDAFFIATSASTVTGLATVDPGTTFTIFGEVVILFLIQIGGLGVMSFASLVVIMMGRKISVKQRVLMQEALNQPSIGGVIRLVRNLFVFSISIQLLAVFFLSLRWVPELGAAKGIYYSVFHAISAYNNAGFALWSDGLMGYVGDPLVNIVISFLFITGGIGFTVLVDLWVSRKWKNLSLHSKVMIYATFIINVLAILLVFLFEFNNPKTLGMLSGTEKFWASYFQGVSPRTAGFNSIDMTAINPDTSLLMILLMFVGAGSTSTGGGVKLTTFVVILFTVAAFLKGKEDTVVMKRTIRNAVVYRALAITTISILFIFAALFVLTYVQKDVSFMVILFEVVSAFGTVGLTMGLTFDLTMIGKIVICAVMIFGKLGPLTLAFSLAKQTRDNIRYPDGEVFTG
ncbi:TrkH family potassium uptake protein [Fictibacillus barbaricus]|uniref:TrkH family potassium uptake protein n=1 Tax=Fictibacillus barbaricus TaxID=182136 RepID=UPI00199CD719|nr:TrkH family potassium uptake protein [Fictibacillus barbaricus]GGB65247.1 ktr system potassium uptake protein B [Fictibacillus barbaricus]